MAERVSDKLPSRDVSSLGLVPSAHLHGFLAVPNNILLNRGKLAQQCRKPDEITRYCLQLPQDLDFEIIVLFAEPLQPSFRQH